MSNFLSGLLQGFAQETSRKRQADQDKKERDAKVKLYEIQLEREKEALARSQQQQESLKALMQKFSQGPQIRGPESPDVMGPPQVQNTPASLTELLADPATLMQMNQAGMIEGRDILSMASGPKKPEKIAYLEALRDNPALAAIEERISRAKGTQVNVGDQQYAKPPPGYYRPEPNKPGLKPEPGGEKDVELRQQASTARAAVDNSSRNLDLLIAEATAIRDDPALWRTTGMAGTIPNAPGSAASDVASRIETLRAKTAFGALQAMRDASKTGGALGNVSNTELELLQNSTTALQTKQSPKAFKDSLQRLIDAANNSKVQLENAYSRTYQSLPEGIPEGSELAGSVDGKPVYRTPDGKMLVVE